jgi:hypothetical protein
MPAHRPWTIGLEGVRSAIWKRLIGTGDDGE